MITNARYSFEFRGLSTDDKSIVKTAFKNGEISNGTIFIEMDTKKVFMWNATDLEWVEL